MSGSDKVWIAQAEEGHTQPLPIGPYRHFCSLDYNLTDARKCLRVLCSFIDRLIINKLKGYIPLMSFLWYL
jgi:hypothetical protein